jgi:hypothetical protein
MVAIAQPHFQPRPVPQRRPHLRLVPPPPPSAAVYRRRRLLALGLLALVLALTLQWGTALLPGAAVPATPAPAAGSALPPSAVEAGSVHVVQPGDTYWSIARSLAPADDVRPLVDRLIASHGSELRVGDRIVLPR